MRTYKHNYLDEVLIRVDFVTPIQSLVNSIPNELLKVILSNFPIQEKNQFPVQSISFGENGVHQETVLKTEWKFYGRSREKFIVLTDEFLSITLKEYISFNSFFSDIELIFKKAFETLDNFHFRRIGMRYVNSIKLLESDLFNWSSYLNDSLIKQFEFYGDMSKYSRLMSSIEFNFNGNNLRFQHGMFNPNYPAKIKEKIYILDYDSYTEGYVDSYQDFEKFVNDSHFKIEELFENSIKDELREMLDKDE